MTLAAIKEKLHQYIDLADSRQAQALLSVIEHDIPEQNETLDAATMNMLHERWEKYISGSSNAYTVEESLENIRKHRAKNGA